MRFTAVFPLLLTLVTVNAPLRAQGPHDAGESGSGEAEGTHRGAEAPASGALVDPTSSTVVRLYLDCRTSCDMDYLRTELGVVDFVRDRTVADVHTLVTTQRTGSGGTAFTLQFLGVGRFAGLDDKLTFATSPDATAEERREAMASHLALGLARYLARTGEATHLRLVSEGGPPPRATPASDPWDSWVFRASAHASLRGEHLQHFLNGNASLSASRITSALKTSLNLWGSYSESRFDLDTGEVALSVNRNYHVSALMVHSVGPHWSAGLSAGAVSDTYANEQVAVNLAPAVEYDLFPYDDATSRQLLVRYAAGLTSVSYFVPTVYDETSELLPQHAMTVRFDSKQPWGSGDLALQTSQYLMHAAQYEVGLSTGMSVRLAPGLSVSVNGHMSLLRDQRGLAQGDASSEEILLQRRELATAYRYSASLGLSYSFGSIYNDVVNPRFAGGSVMNF